MSLTVPFAVEELVTGRRRRVLIVNDVLREAELLSQLLERLGQETHIVTDASLALEAALVFLPDIAILDIDMPKLNGFDFAEAFRQRTEFKKIGLFALSGWVDKSTQERCRQRGFDRFFAKPTPFDQICFAMTEFD